MFGSKRRIKALEEELCHALEESTQKDLEILKLQEQLKEAQRANEEMKAELAEKERELKELQLSLERITPQRVMTEWILGEEAAKDDGKE